MVVPAEFFFISNGPDQPEPAGGDTENGPGKTVGALFPGRHTPVKIEQPKPAPDHSGTVSAGQPPQSTVENEDPARDDNEDRDAENIEGRCPAHYAENCEKQAEARHDQAEIQGRGDQAMYGMRDRMLAASGRRHAGLAFGWCDGTSRL